MTIALRRALVRRGRRAGSFVAIHGSGGAPLRPPATLTLEDDGVGIRERQVERSVSLQALGFRDGQVSAGRINGRSDPGDGAPLALPAEALFTELRGTFRTPEPASPSPCETSTIAWSMGVLYQRVLRGYRATYQVLEGASEEPRICRYSGDYHFVTPIAGVAFPHEFGA